MMKKPLVAPFSSLVHQQTKFRRLQRLQIKLMSLNAGYIYQNLRLPPVFVSVRIDMETLLQAFEDTPIAVTGV